MQKETAKWIRILTIVLVFLAIVSLIYITDHKRERISKLEEAVQETLAPATELFQRMSSSLAGTWRQLVLWSKLDEENQKFREQIGVLEERVGKLEEYRLENQRLRDLLEFQEQNQQTMELVAAQVVGRSPVNWFSTITINKGATSGLKKDQAVITPQGIVGVVRSTTPSTASVLLLSDAQMAIGGLVRESRHLVLVEGKADRPGFCNVRGLTADVKLKKGDLIISSGLGGIFPKGLALGKITVVERGKYGLGYQGLLRSAVDLSRLEEVFVVKDFYTPQEEEVSKEENVQ
jgi:rod shape-determining protein MreC